MRLYYTGATRFLDPQTNPRQSIGGYASSTPISFDGNGNIFGGISDDDSASRVVRGLMLRNDTPNTATQVRLWYNNKSTDSVVNIRTAVVIPTPDDVMDVALERLANESDLPYDAVFTDNRGEGNFISIPDVPSGDYVGIWVERTVNRFQIGENKKCDSLYERFNIVDANQELTIAIPSTVDKTNAYFTLGDKFYVWLNQTDGTSTDPQIGSLEGIRVNVLGADSNSEVISKVLQQVNSILRPRGEYQSTTPSTITSLNIGRETAS